jgi:peptidoglycan hydrolase CwlO-like protein
MIKKAISISVLFVISCITIYSIFIVPAHAQNCSNESECKKLIEEYENKLSGIRKQKNTLSSEIQYADTQIYLTTARIYETELKIKQTEEEIISLGEKIEGLNTSLDYLGKVLIKKIVEGYKRKETTIVDLVVDSNNAMSLSNQLKYIQIAQDNDRRIAFQVQTAKNNFEEQKALREKKKIELAALQITLNNQKVSLNNQKAAKQRLLDVTKNDENTYQTLLEKARQELSGFSSFVNSTGDTGLKSFGNGSNGWYFSQRDPAWGNMTLGNSNYPVWEAGCAISSVAMVCKKYGQSISPASIANDNSQFYSSSGYLLNDGFNCDGKSQEWIGASKDSIKSYIDRGIPIILRLYASSVSGLHFVVGWKFDGDELIIHDPYYGPDVKFSDRYSWGQITTAIAIY